MPEKCSCHGLRLVVTVFVLSSQKTMAIFLILLLKQLHSDWFLAVSFVFSANQKPFVFCTRVTSLHSCFKFALVLQKNCTPLSANQN